MPERRRGEPEYEDPREQSLIKKAAKMEFGNPVVDALIRVIILLAMSGGAGYVSSENKSAEVEHLKEQLTRVESEQKSKWKAYYERRREMQADHVCYERRFTRLEGKVRIEAPACSAPVPLGAEERN